MKDELALSRIYLVREIDARQLVNTSVLIGGVGNVGSHAAFYLALAGVGRLVLLDRDTVGPENLCSPVFMPEDVGKKKVDAVRDRLAIHAPWVAVETIHADLRVGVPEYLFSAHEALVIATDSWDSRAHMNRWAHCLPGDVQIVVSGGLTGLNWDVFALVPGSGTGCVQCVHGDEMLNADETGGCGLSAPSTGLGPDAAAGFTGATIAGVMVSEIVSTLAGPGPRYAGQALSFEYATGQFRALRIRPNEECAGHRRLVDGDDAVFMTKADYTLNEIAEFVASRLNADVEEVILASNREMLLGYSCRTCGSTDRVWRPVILVREDGLPPCTKCGGLDLDVRTDTVLPIVGLTLAEIGYPVGKALLAWVQGRKFEVVQVG